MYIFLFSLILTHNQYTEFIWRAETRSSNDKVKQLPQPCAVCRVCAINSDVTSQSYTPSKSRNKVIVCFCSVTIFSRVLSERVTPTSLLYTFTRDRPLFTRRLFLWQTTKLRHCSFIGSTNFTAVKRLLVLPILTHSTRWMCRTTHKALFSSNDDKFEIIFSRVQVYTRMLLMAG